MTSRSPRLASDSPGRPPGAWIFRPWNGWSCRGPGKAGAVAVEAFLAAHPEVTALAAFDDDIALRSLTALRDLGVRVPEEMAVMGFDETEYGSLPTPALTTVHIDAEVLGRIAARGALGIDTEGLAAVPGRVVVRASV